MFTEYGVPIELAFNRIYFVDQFGLLGKNCDRANQAIAPYVKNDLKDKLNLMETVSEVKPTVLIGLTGVGGIFTEEIIREMYKNCKKPIIFPLSNPTKNSEAVPKDLYDWTEGNAIVATGSPFDPVDYKGIKKHPSQGNNMYIFPAIGFVGINVKAKRISYKMLNKSAIALAESLTDEEIKLGMIYPRINRIREVSLRVSVGVAKAAFEQKVATIEEPGDLERFLADKMWSPAYHNLIFRREF